MIFLDDRADAIVKYSEAIACQPNNEFLWSNRAATLVRIGSLDRALSDALKLLNRLLSFADVKSDRIK
jgi:predicted Zn-dependent protease